LQGERLDSLKAHRLASATGCTKQERACVAGAIRGQARHFRNGVLIVLATCRATDDGNANKPTVSNAAKREAVMLDNAGVTVMLADKRIRLGKR
jgi:hypothetical protein